MKTSPVSGFFPPLNLLLSGLILAVVLFGAISQVWIRQQISRTALQIEQHESDLRDFGRKNQYLSARLAELHRPDELIRRAGNDLHRPSEKQIVWVRREFDSDGTSRTIAYSRKIDVAMAN